MRACFGILGQPIENAPLEEAQRLIDAEAMPIVDGTLMLFAHERYELLFDRLLGIASSHRGYRYILTTGSFNDSARPLFYDLYCRFAMAEERSEGELLFCAQTYAKAGARIRLYPIVDYQPLSTGCTVGFDRITTRFGVVEPSDVWYTKQNVSLVDPREPLEFMTRGSELDFWYSPAGFIYLAHQVMIIRVYNAHPRRVIIFSRNDVSSQRFLKLIFLFEEIGLEMYLVYEDDLSVFTQQAGMDDVLIFSRAGAYSFLKIADSLFLSDRSSVADTISLAQEDLVNGRGVHRSVGSYMAAYQVLLDGHDKGDLRRRARTAKGLLQKFISYPIPTQRVVLETLVERWRTL